MVGMLNRSSHVPPAIPPSSSASSRTARWAAGIQVGLGSPWPWVDLMVQPNGPRCARGHTAAETRADDNDVIIEACHDQRVNGRQANYYPLVT